MIIAFMQINLKISHSNSLKEKRAIIRPLVEKLKKNYNISIAEVDHQDLWQLATLGIAMVSNSKTYLQEVFDKMINDVIKLQGDYQILSHQINFT